MKHNFVQRVQQTCGPVTEALSVVVGELLPGTREMLEDQGCKIIAGESGTTVITYPEGSTRQELWPRTMDSRFRIVLPGGCELREIHTRYSELKGLYFVLPKTPLKTPESLRE